MAASSALAADRVYTPDADLAWARQRDKAIRARLEQGDLDSLVNLLLFGTSFTSQARIKIENLSEASKSGLVRARVDDLVAGMRKPGGNERLIFLSDLLRRKGVDIDGPDAGKFVYDQLLRDLQERRTYAVRAAEAKPESALDRGSLFDDRGLSLDTSILPDFSLDQTLRDLKKRGVLREDQVSRVAVIGPGLDFIDKNDASAYDYYPQQSLQPFALYDSLLRLGLAQPEKLAVSIFDINSRVIDHFQRARERARKNTGYVLQLPRDIARPWSPDLAAYWSALGNQVGATVPPIKPPAIFKGLQTRAVRVRPDVVLACEPVDLNIVVERLNLPAAERFDLIVGTNIFVYYDPSEQTLALENAGAMLKSGGLLLTNDRLPQASTGTMRQAGMTVVSFDDRDPAARGAMGWYRKQ
ncbi:MAG TPA: hypothetical protein VH639_09800 [Bryobacteraceae bacterium]